MLIVNADDWGRNKTVTDNSLICLKNERITSVSAMVFMEDSERAATIAKEHAIDAGLHLNLTSPFSAGNCPSKLRHHQEKTASYLMRHRFAQVIFHPGLMNAFDYAVKAQLEEYGRIYGMMPSRIDGHHHMHLCANIISQDLLPWNTMVRRNFSFEPGEKSLWNRLYRRGVDALLTRRHRLTDYFFSLAPLQPESRIERIVSLSRVGIVEVETHPVKQEEYRFLMDGGIVRLVKDYQGLVSFLSGKTYP